MLKKVSILILVLIPSFDLSASERERTPRPSIPFSRFLTPTCETIGDIEKHAKELENAQGKTNEEEYFRLLGLATTYAKLRDNHRGRGQGTIYRKYDELQKENDQKALELNEKMLIREQIECLKGHIKKFHQDEKLKPFEAWFASEPFYAQIARLSERNFPNIHQQSLAKLKHIENLKFQHEVLNLIRECRSCNNKAGMLINFKTLRKTVVDQERINNINKHIARLEKEVVIDQKKYDFEIAVSAMLDNNSAPLQCYQNVVTYCQKHSHDPDLKSLCDEKQQLFQAAVDAEQRHIDKVTKIKTELARAPEEILAPVVLACKIVPYQVGKVTTDRLVEAAKTERFANEEEKQVALANALHARSNFYYQYPVTHAIEGLKDKQQAEDIALDLANKPELFSRLSLKINPYRLGLKLTHDKVEAIKAKTFTCIQEKQVALANAFYERYVFYNSYPEKHAQAAREDKKRFEEIVDLLLEDNCPESIFSTLNPVINPLVVK